MYKFFLLFFIFFNFLFSSTVYNGNCIDSFNTKDRFIILQYSNGQNGWTYYNETKINTLVSNLGKFKYNKKDNTCDIVSASYILGLKSEYFNFLTALTGLLTGYLICFIVLIRF